MDTTDRDIKELMKFYQVDTLDELVRQQAYHIEQLQSKLTLVQAPVRLVQRVREG